MTETQAVPVPRFGTSAPCGSNPAIGDLISSSKSGHGGARENSGGARPNSGGARENSGGARPNAGRKPRLDVSARKCDVAHWYCVRTGHGEEIAADIAIRLAGYTVFSPSLWKPATIARRNPNGSIRPALPDRIEPLFRRYLFVAFTRSADDWQLLRRLAGVDSILGTTPDTPAAVPHEAIALIRQLPGMQRNDCLYPENVELTGGAPVVHLTPGSTARLLGGPLGDLTGICQWSDSKRVRFLLQLFGREVLMTVPRAAVEAV